MEEDYGWREGYFSCMRHFLGTVILLRTRHPPVYLSSFYNLQRGMIYENTVCMRIVRDARGSTRG